MAALLPGMVPHSSFTGLEKSSELIEGAFRIREMGAHSDKSESRSVSKETAMTSLTTATLDAEGPLRACSKASTADTCMSADFTNRRAAVSKVWETEMQKVHASTKSMSCRSSSRSHLEMWRERNETLIIFDWDDTLCPTTHFDMRPDCAEKDAEALAEHARAVEVLLRTADHLGQVSVVSMAQAGWIESTTEKLMPSVKKVFDELNIQVSLARENVPSNEKRHALADERSASHYLKRRTMAKLLRSFYTARIGRKKPAHKGRSWKNVISIGDSPAERLALQDVVMRRVQRDGKGAPKECRCKTVQLKEDPTLAELTEQVKAMTMWLATIVHHDGDLDFDVGAGEPDFK